MTLHWVSSSWQRCYVASARWWFSDTGDQQEPSTDWDGDEWWLDDEWWLANLIVDGYESVLDCQEWTGNARSRTNIIVHISIKYCTTSKRFIAGNRSVDIPTQVPVLLILRLWAIGLNNRMLAKNCIQKCAVRNSSSWSVNCHVVLSPSLVELSSYGWFDLICSYLILFFYLYSFLFIYQ